ncbi:hypothetical protein DNF23_50260 [Pseudomonas syringae pv. pisi]
MLLGALILCFVRLQQDGRDIPAKGGAAPGDPAAAGGRRAATRCARRQDLQPELQRAIGAAASIVPAAPTPHLIDVLLEAVSDRQACTWWASCSRRRGAAATRCARRQDPQPELQRAIGAARQHRAGRAGSAPGRRAT